MELTPRGHHYALNNLLPGPDGLQRLSLVSKNGDLRVPRTYPNDKAGDSEPDIVLGKGLDERIEEKLRERVLLAPHQVPEDYPVILTVKVDRRGGKDDPRYRLTITRIKYLIDISDQALWTKNYPQAFKYLELAPDESRVDVGDSVEWRDRMGKYISNTRAIYARQAQGERNALFNSIQSQFNAAGAAGAASQAAGQAQFIRRIRGY